MPRLTFSVAQAIWPRRSSSPWIIEGPTETVEAISWRPSGHATVARTVDPPGVVTRGVTFAPAGVAVYPQALGSKEMRPVRYGKTVRPAAVSVASVPRELIGPPLLAYVRSSSEEGKTNASIW